ncbi:MAG: helix-turn-helix domain-containing protein [bacterium]
MKSIHSEEYKSIINKLKKVRIEVGLTQKEVSKILKKPQSYISKIENCERRLDILKLKELASIYKKDLTYFLNSNEKD